MEAAATVRRLMHEARFGALATLEPEGAPYASLVAIATAMDGSPTFLISTLARHTQNLSRDTRVSLLISASSTKDPLNSPRASLLGRIAVSEDAEVRARYLARHWTSKNYADFKDFAFYVMTVESAHLVEGFGRIVDVDGAELTVDWTGAEALKEAQAGVIAHMNADHLDAIERYATVLLKAEPGKWRMIGIDPEGCDLAKGDLVLRLAFPERVNGPGEIRKTLVGLVNAAKAQDAEREAAAERGEAS